jgi:hypothetical protein
LLADHEPAPNLVGGTYGPNAGDSVHVNGKQCGATYTAAKVDARGPAKEKAEKTAKTEDSGSEGKKKK